MVGARAVIPDDADVANAIGAITSNVVVQRAARIRTNDLGLFAVEGIPQLMAFKTLDEAHAHAVESLEEAVRGLARESGTSERAVDTQFEDKIASTADGSELFLERTILVRLSGRPDRVAVSA
jgi:hypothetical protein